MKWSCLHDGAGTRRPAGSGEICGPPEPTWTTRPDRRSRTVRMSVADARLPRPCHALVAPATDDGTSGSGAQRVLSAHGRHRDRGTLHVHRDPGTRVGPQREVVVAREHGELKRMALPHDVVLRLQVEREAILLTGADRRRLTAVVPILRI